MENIKTTQEAHVFGTKLSKPEAIAIWKEYKKRLKIFNTKGLEELKSKETDKLEFWGQHGFVSQIYRESVEGFLGMMGEHSLTPEEIERRLGIIQNK